jgi:hypothetical protein
MGDQGVARVFVGFGVELCLICLFLPSLSQSVFPHKKEAMHKKCECVSCWYDWKRGPVLCLFFIKSEKKETTLLEPIWVGTLDCRASSRSALTFL